MHCMYSQEERAKNAGAQLSFSVQSSTKAKDVGLPDSSMNQDNLHNDDQAQANQDNSPSTGMLKDYSR